MREGVIEERFLIEAQVGAGGMGVVFRARDNATGGLVALKVLSTSDRGHRLRFEREATILSELSHPAIVKYVTHGTTDIGMSYLAMEWVEGETLLARLTRTGLSIADTLTIGRHIADALGHAHAHGVVHRDIKPNNLILRGGEPERVAVLDFGIARAAAAAGSLTTSGVMIGTPAYMAPEQARGDRDVGPAADVFSLGCVLYECLTGQMAFEGKHLLALVAKVVLWEPPPVRSVNPDVSVDLDALITSMIAKDVASRPANGADVAARIAATAAAQPTSGPRRTRLQASPTVLGPATPQFVSIVVASAVAAADGEAPPLAPEQLRERHDMLASALDPDLRLEVLYDGSVVVIVPQTRSAGDLIQRAIRCARAIRDTLPDALIAIATGGLASSNGEPSSALLEASAKALAREAMTVVFANVSVGGRPVGAIRLDDQTATYLDPSRVVRVGAAAYLASDAG